MDKYDYEKYLTFKREMARNRDILAAGYPEVSMMNLIDIIDDLVEQVYEITQWIDQEEQSKYL